MGVLTRMQLESRINNGGLLRNPRRNDDGRLDIEADSYDLSAGTAVWKQRSGERKEQAVKTLQYSPESSEGAQPTVTVQPGQMIFVVTFEDVLMPLDLCGTVYSRNRLALQGILALNAGHVDPGYEGPITIRLINLRAIPWTLILGKPIFTITFQTLDSDQDDLPAHTRHISQEAMISRVLETADAALSNALYDLYAVDVDRRLNDFKTESLEQFRKERDDRWVRREEIWGVLLDSIWKKILAGLYSFFTLAAGVGAILYIIITILRYFSE